MPQVVRPWGSYRARLACGAWFAALALGACAPANQPVVSPAPGPTEDEGLAAVEATEAATDSVLAENEAGAVLIEEDPVAPAPPADSFEGPSDDEIDASIRDALGDDPLDLVSGDEPQLPLEMNERVEAWINYFQNVIPERFALYLERKGRYEAMVREKLREQGMPQDLIYLSLIESGINPNAYSRARAVGMWQFISSTARMYDLEVSAFVDERRDPEKSTDAALRYLSDLYDQFDSWYLAAAAYNGGPGRISRGLRRVENGTFWDLADRQLLRAETRNYVPKLIAATIIGHDPERYGFGDVVKQEPWDYETVRIPDATSFDVLAEAAGTDEETLRELNPQFPQRVTPPGREVDVRIPPAGAVEFEARYAAIPLDERVSWTFHTVTRGQTLGQIAGRYGVSVSAIRAANNNVDPRRLGIGQRLVIPSPARVAQASTPRSSSAASAAALETQQGPVTVVVRRGDSLWSIARRFSVSTRQIMDWNGLSSTLIKPGDRLEIRR